MGKTINVFLIDGKPTERIKCTLQNWTGVAYKIPRTQLELCKDGTNDIVRHLKQTGIYFLLGENMNDGNNAIYVGQAVARKNGEGLLCRLLEHKRNDKEKYWKDWNEVVVLTTQNNSFGPTEISYLENQFTNLAKAAARYDVKNGNEPNIGNLTEEKESELIEFIEYSKIIMGILGYNVFEKLVSCAQVSPNAVAVENSPIFKFKGKLQASAIFTTEGFVLLKGSEIKATVSKSVHASTIKARTKYASKIVENVTTEDLLFTSSSAAADFVGGCSLSGNVVWVTSDGKVPKDFNF